MGRGRAKGRSPVAFELRPDERSRCAEHLGEIVTRFPRCAHLTGGSHDLTTDDAAQQEVLSFARIATTLLQERLPWVRILLYPTASERGECMLALCSSGYSQRWRWEEPWRSFGGCTY